MSSNAHATLCWRPHHRVLKMKKLRLSEISVIPSKVSCHYVAVMGYTEVLSDSATFHHFSHAPRCHLFTHAPIATFLIHLSSSLALGPMSGVVGWQRRRSFVVWNLLRVFLDLPTYPPSYPTLSHLPPSPALFWGARAGMGGRRRMPLTVTADFLPRSHVQTVSLPELGTLISGSKLCCPQFLGFSLQHFSLFIQPSPCSIF